MHLRNESQYGTIQNNSEESQINIIDKRNPIEIVNYTRSSGGNEVLETGQFDTFNRNQHDKEETEGSINPKSMLVTFRVQGGDKSPTKQTSRRTPNRLR
jgi:hypothetical protein